MAAKQASNGLDFDISKLLTDFKVAYALLQIIILTPLKELVREGIF